MRCNKHQLSDFKLETKEINISLKKIEPLKILITIGGSLWLIYLTSEFSAVECYLATVVIPKRTSGHIYSLLSLKQLMQWCRKSFTNLSRVPVSERNPHVTRKPNFLWTFYVGNNTRIFKWIIPQPITTT